MMSFAISLSNLKHNKKLYQVYFLAQLVIFSLFFMLQCFSTDSVIVARLAEDADIKTMIQTISLFFVLFIVFFFVFYCSFLKEKKAFGGKKSPQSAFLQEYSGQEHTRPVLTK